MMNQDKDEWGPWIDHDGSGCPCKGMLVRVVHKYSNGKETEREAIAGLSGGFSWDWRYSKEIHPNFGKFATRIIRYRIRKPRGMTILQDLIADLPAPVSPKVDA